MSNNPLSQAQLSVDQSNNSPPSADPMNKDSPTSTNNSSTSQAQLSVGQRNNNLPSPSTDPMDEDVPTSTSNSSLSQVQLSVDQDSPPNQDSPARSLPPTDPTSLYRVPLETPPSSDRLLEQMSAAALKSLLRLHNRDIHYESEIYPAISALLNDTLPQTRDFLLHTQALLRPVVNNPIGPAPTQTGPEGLSGLSFSSTGAVHLGRRSGARPFFFAL